MQRRQRQIQPTDLKAKAVGTVVRELRKQAGHSQGNASAPIAASTVPTSAVWNEGSVNPTVSRLWMIADVLENPTQQAHGAHGTLDRRPRPTDGATPRGEANLSGRGGRIPFRSLTAEQGVRLIRSIIHSFEKTATESDT